MSSAIDDDRLDAHRRRNMPRAGIIPEEQLPASDDFKKLKHRGLPCQIDYAIAQSRCDSLSQGALARSANDHAVPVWALRQEVASHCDESFRRPRAVTLTRTRSEHPVLSGN